MTNIISQIEELEKSVEPSKPLELMTEGEKIQYFLDTRGWIPLRFEEWLHDTIILCRDSSVTRYPNGYAAYTEQELEQVIGIKDMHLIHAIKKIGGVITK